MRFAGWPVLSTVTVVFFAAAVPTHAQGYTSSGGDNRSPAIKTLESCFEKTYPDGAYLSTDGGRSAKRLLAKCRDEWNGAAKECQAATGDSSQNCNSRTGSLAQEFIRQQEREMR
jgi:hypothetical protein